MQQEYCGLGHAPVQICKVSRSASPWHRPGRTGHILLTLDGERIMPMCFR